MTNGTEIAFRLRWVNHEASDAESAAPPREATYHETVQLGYLMSELQAYYNAFAFRPCDQ